MVALLFSSVTPAIAGTVTANFTSASTIPVTAASYTATGNSVALSLGFAPPTGTNLTIVNNTGLPFISGQFSNLAQGQAVYLTYGSNAYRFVANYYGGTGNDLVLQWGFQNLASWGYNSNGQLGNGGTANSSVPVLVTQGGVLAGKTVVSAAAGGAHSLALYSDGTVASWGYNSNGQLGNNSTTSSTVPVLVTQTGVLAGRTVVSVAAGWSHSLAMCSDGTVAAWGSNGSGQLGIGSTTNSSLPFLVTQSGVLAGKKVISVSAGYSHNLVLCSDGTMAAWGSNGSGQLGNNSTTQSNVPVLVTQTGVLAGKTIVSVAAGQYHNLALCSDGTLATWGSNSNGQLGIGNTTNSSVPVLVTQSGVLAGKTVVSIAGGLYYSLVLCSDGTMVAWGSNAVGQLGNNSTTQSSVPVLVTQSGVLAGKTVISMAAGYMHCLALCSDSTVAAWGDNVYGELGNNSTTSSSVPVLVTQSGVLAGSPVVSVVAVNSQSLALAGLQNPTDIPTWLSGLSLSSGIFYLPFDPLTTVYDTDVPYAVPSVTVTPTAAVNGASITVNGSPAISGLASQTIPLAVGINTITIIVTGPDGITTKTYTINVYRHQGSSDSTLNSLALSSGTLSPSFASATTSYTASVTNASTSITVVPTCTDSNATVTVNGATVPSGTHTAAIPLTVGSNTINTVVTSQDGTTTTTYTITVTRTPSSVSTLSGLVPSSGTLSPAFAPTTTLYSASVSNATTSITIRPTVTDSTATVTVNGTAVASGTNSVAIPLVVGNNTITFLVTAQDGTTTSTYTLAVTRVSSVSTLSGLAMSSGTLSPSFATATTSYTATVPNATTSITVTPTVTDPTATIKVNGTTVVSGTNSAALPLAMGTNTITTVVTAQDGTTTSTYTITVTRISSVSTLSGLVLSSGTLNPTFVPATTSYIASVTNATTSITVRPTVTDQAATVKVNGATVTSGTNSAAIPLVVGNNTITVLVTAQDGITTSTYTLTVTRLSTVSTLSSLVPSSGTLSPSFATATTSYTASVTNATTSISVRPTLTDPTATVKVNGTSVASGTNSGSLPLVAGNNTISVQVTAQDGITKTTYTITVTRAYLAVVFTSATAIPIQASSYNATGNAVNVTLGFAPPTGTNLTVINNTGLGFITGQFTNLAQGQAVNLTYNGVTYPFVANYYGGTGNDLVLQWAKQDLAAWGYNKYGQLGNNSTVNSSVPVLVTNSGVLAGKTVLSVASGIYHSLALCSDGTVAAWGYNNYGQLGNNSYSSSSVPVAVTQSGVLAGKTVIALSAGVYYSLALCSDGTLAAWGSNMDGELGNNGSTTESIVPVLVTQSGVLAGKTVVSMATGDRHCLVLCSDGTLAAWGYNSDGELGNGSSNNHITLPALVTQSGVLAGKTVISIAAGGYHSFALCSDGTLAAWGLNNNGQLGNNSTTNSSVPVDVTQSGVLAGKTVVSVAAGGSHTLALCSDGTLAAWGYNSSGQLGNNSTTNSSVPVAVTNTGVLSGKTVISVTVSSTTNGGSMALCSDGTLAAWGDNTYGQLGNGGTTNSSIPLLIPQSWALAGKTVAAVAADGGNSLALAARPLASPVSTLSALTLSTGRPNPEVLNPAFSPAQMAYTVNVRSAISSITVTPTVMDYPATVRVNGAVVTSGSASAPIALAMGSNTISVVVTAEDGISRTTYTIVVSRGTLNIAFATANSIPVTASSYNASGININFSLGYAPPNGTNLTVINNTGLAFINGQFSNLAQGQAVNLTYNGVTYPFVANYYGGTGNDLVLQWARQDVVAWGDNLNGQLGNNSETNSNVPVAVMQSGALAGKTVISVSAGLGHSLALCADGTLAAWGRNDTGQLGNNSMTDSSVPVAVVQSGILSGKTVVAISVGEDHSLALCSDGTLAAWGNMKAP